MGQHHHRYCNEKQKQISQLQSQIQQITHNLRPPKFNDAKDLVRFMFEQTYNDVIGGIDIPFGIIIYHKNDFSELTKACDSFLFDKEATRKVIVNGTSHYPVDGITPLILAIMSGMNKKNNRQWPLSK